jgi:Flp pilus assembly protein TadG
MNRQIKSKTNTENGQAIVLLALGAVVMLGFAALAIDGGMVYADQRHAQNAADAASLAGAAAAADYMETQGIYYDGFCGSISNLVDEAESAAVSRAGSNNYTITDGDISANNGVQATCKIDGNDRYLEIVTRITRSTDTSLIHFVYNGPVQEQVEAVTHVRPRQPLMAGYAIVSMRDCTTAGGHNYGITGGGNSGGVETFQGGMFVNSPESGSCCAIDPPSSSGAIGIVAHDGFSISSVGSCDYSGEDNISPEPIQTGLNGGSSISDPLADMPMPTCGSSGQTNVTVDGTTYDYGPGNWSGGSLGDGTYAPGIYCISGDLSLSGNNAIDASSGVLLYMIDGGTRFTGNAGMTLVAPDASTCTGTAGDTSASCSYPGIAVIMDRNNYSTFEVRGNGGDAIVGLIYAINGTVQARGGGSDPDETNVEGQVIAGTVLGNGNGSFKVTYTENYDFGDPPKLDMNK